MQLTHEQLSGAVNGVLDVVPQENGYYLRRFTDAQRDHQYTPENRFYRSSFMAPGAKLDFTTDAGTLTVHLTNCDFKSGHRVYAVDLWEDGVLTAHRPRRAEHDGPVETPIPLEDIRETFTLQPGEKRVELFFPWNVRYLVKSVELDDGATFVPTTYKRAMIAFGDSITASCTVQFPSFAYTPRVARALDARLYSYAIGGEVFSAEKLLPGSFPKADFVTVAYGTNGRLDGSGEPWQKGLDGFFGALDAAFPDTPVFVILPIHRMGEEGDDGGRFPLRIARQCIMEACREHKQVTVLHGENYVSWDSALYEDAILHPNDMGMCFYAENLVADLKKHLSIE